MLPKRIVWIAAIGLCAFAMGASAGVGEGDAEPALSNIEDSSPQSAAAATEQALREQALRRDNALLLSAEGVQLKSASAVVFDETTGRVIYGKNADAVVPIASITKLMTAMVTLDAGLDLDEPITLTAEEARMTRITTMRSPLQPGVTLSRDELLHLALMASDNRAAAALAVSYPGGAAAFVEAMNVKAKMIDMQDSHFADPTGLDARNVASAVDLVRMVRAAHDYTLIREYSTSPQYDVTIKRRRYTFSNTNGLVRNSDWNIGLQKTGFIRPSGRCLVMYTRLVTGPVIIVLLDSIGMYTRLVDAARIRQWLEPGYTPPVGLTRAVERELRPKARPKAPATGTVKPVKPNTISHRAAPQQTGNALHAQARPELG
jgi:D-alanyl-D-alanine endopeptidase (penicillin-binding protein 7)